PRVLQPRGRGGSNPGWGAVPETSNCNQRREASSDQSCAMGPRHVFRIGHAFPVWASSEDPGGKLRLGLRRCWRESTFTHRLHGRPDLLKDGHEPLSRNPYLPLRPTVPENPVLKHNPPDSLGRREPRGGFLI